MLITSCMRSASSSMHLFLKDFLNLDKVVYPRYTTRDWRNGEGLKDYMCYPSSTAFEIEKEILTDWITNRKTIIQEHLLPIQHHRDVIMNIPKDRRKVVVMKRNAEDSFSSQLRRRGECPYLSKTTNKNQCLESFKKFRNDIDLFFPEHDGFLHIEFSDVISNPDKEIKKILNYWEYPYDSNNTFKLPHLK